MKLPPVDPAFRWHAEPWGFALVCAPLQASAQHLFTSKQLQLRASTPGDAQAQAWTHATASVDGGLDQLMRIKQVHGRTVRVLRRPTDRAVESRERPEADAIVSNDAGLVLAVQVADCVPILMADVRTGSAAAVHAGWRGSCAGIAAATVEAMTREFGTAPGDLVVALGPSIGTCCYEVGAELADAFRAAGASTEQIDRWFTRTGSGSLRLDLWAVNRDQLVAAGIAEPHLHSSQLCTQTHAEIFESYRADGSAAGRMAALIRVPPQALSAAQR